MSNENSNLILEYEEPNHVIFRRTEGLDEEHWLELLKWWSDGAAFNSKSSQFKTTLEVFSIRKSWFNRRWKNRGRSIAVSDKLKEILDTQKQVIQHFDLANQALANIQINELDFSDLKRQPTNAQKFNVSASLLIPNGANFSVPGSGKTMTSLIIWSVLQKKSEIDKLLVVCPKSAFEVWSEIEPQNTFVNPPKTEIFSDFGINSKTKILITNFETLESENNLNQLLNWSEKNNPLLIIDEAHRIKGGGKSVRWRACKKLAHIAKRVDLLTGTPMPQGYDDIRNLLQLSWKYLPHNYLTDSKLSTMKHGGVFVRTTKDELNLPPLCIKEVPLALSTIQKHIYDALRKTYSGTFKISSASQEIFAQKSRAVMTLIAVASNPGLLAGRFSEDAYLNLKWPPRELNENSEIFDLVKNYVSLEIPPKYEWAIQFVKSAAERGEKTLIWSSFVGNLLAINKLLEPYSPAIIHGSINQIDRKKELKRFREDPNCFVLITNPQTLGEGVSLHECCHQAIYIDRTYNAGQYLQSLDRIHRLGLPEDIITKVYILTSDLTIDNSINLRLAEKIKRMADLLNDKSLLASGTLFENDLEENEMIGIDNLDLDDLYKHLLSDF